MAFVQADLDRINSAIASGERRVKFSDREIEYRDISDMLLAKSQIEKELAAAAGTITRVWPMKYSGF
ncbi:MAG: phage head-tail joining protein [Wenzhouxiangella sp.]